MKPINDQNWAELGKAFQQAVPFPSICIDNFLDNDFALELSRSYPNFSNAQKQGKEFRTVNEKSKVQITHPDHFPTPVTKLHKALADPSFISSMQTLSGISDLSFDHNFSGGGMHITSRSGILDVHVDFNYSEQTQLYRRLNLLIYLNEDWQQDWGGEVELWDKDVKNCVESFAPELNRCVIFATSDFSYHGVTAVNAPLDKPRKSFAIYLYNNEPNSTLHGEHHNTIFKARPNERFKKYYLMPVESGLRKLSSTYQSSKQFVKRLLNQQP